MATALLLGGCRRQQPSTHPSTAAGGAPNASATAAMPPPTASAGPPAQAVPRVAVLILENHEYDAVIGSQEAPFLGSLARRSVLLTRSFAIGHPSLPNYLALLGGSTFGVDSRGASSS